MSGFQVSRDGKWVAGAAAVGEEDPLIDTAHVLAVDARTCLVIPGSNSLEAASFTPDSKAVIIRRHSDDGPPELREFALASLQSGCPQQVATRRVTSIGG